MSNQIDEHKFVSFDGNVHCSGTVVVPDIESEITPVRSEGRSIIPRGAGMSFSAASFGDDVLSIDMTRLNRIQALDAKNCTVTVEAGTPVGTLLDYLMERGYYLPILPGYPTITVGGCIAADVHGKNQLKDGTFVGQVLNFRLFHEEHGHIDVSPEKEKELFELTLGGFGLTGTILSATIKILPLPSMDMDVVTEPILDVRELPALLADRAEHSDFIISWHDFIQAGSKFGNGFVQWGNFRGGTHGSTSGITHNDSTDDTIKKAAERRAKIGNATVVPIKLEPNYRSPLTLTSENRGNISGPFFGYMTTGMMNALYNYMQVLTIGPPRELGAELCFFPSKILRDLYFHFFGKPGLFEHQAVVPVRNFDAYIDKVQWWLGRNELPITIASSKMFRGKKELLRFADDGVCFALDFPHCSAGMRFLEFLDELTIEVQALPNISKDSRLPLSVVQATYPEYEKFRTMLHSYDPKRRYQSELSRRLKL